MYNIIVSEQIDSAQALRLDAQLCFALYSASNMLGRSYQRVLGPLDLTYLQYITMLVLWEEDGVRVKDLSGRLRLDSGTMTPLLKRMEAKGLLERTRSTEDERVVLIRLTRKGKNLKRRAAKVPAAVSCTFDLSIDEALSLKHLCERLVDGASD